MELTPSRFAKWKSFKVEERSIDKEGVEVDSFLEEAMKLNTLFKKRMSRKSKVNDDSKLAPEERHQLREKRATEAALAASNVAFSYWKNRQDKRATSNNKQNINLVELQEKHRFR